MKRKTNLIRYKNVTNIDVNDPDHLHYLVCEWCFSYGQIREAVRITKSTDVNIVHNYLLQQKAIGGFQPKVRIIKFVHQSNAS